MKTVWKFPLQITDHQLISMPARARVVHVGLDPMREPCLWALVNPVAAPVERPVYVTGTGRPTPDGDNRHLGSFVQDQFVWHVWEPC